MFAVAVRLGLDHRAKLVNVCAANRVIVDHMDLVADDLIPPDRRIVPVSQIPGGMHRHLGLVVNLTDPALFCRLSQILTVERPEDRGLE